MIRFLTAPFPSLPAHAAIALAGLMILAPVEADVRQNVWEGGVPQQTGAPPPGQQSSTGQQVPVHVDRDTVGVGDYLQVSFSVDREPGSDEVIYPDSSNFGPDFEIIDRSVERGNNTDSLFYRLQYFGGDKPAVPGLEVHYISGDDTLTRRSHTRELAFLSVVEDPEDPFRPIKDLYSFTAGLLPWVLLGLLALLGVWLAYYYRDRWMPWLSRPDAPPGDPEHRLDPVETLQADLDMIKQRYPDPSVDYRQFYGELSDAIRRYFDRVHRLPALESTTAELLAELHRSDVDESLIKQCSHILQEADMAKFARFAPGRGKAIQTLETAYAFIEQACAADAVRLEGLRRHDAHHPPANQTGAMSP